jgi:hypothetical protein
MRVCVADVQRCLFRLTRGFQVEQGNAMVKTPRNAIGRRMCMKWTSAD